MSVDSITQPVRAESTGRRGSGRRTRAGGLTAGFLVARHSDRLRARACVIAPIYIGLAVSDGRRTVIGVVANTRWWPPFCLVVDFVAATIIAVEIVAGVQFHA